MKKTVLFSLLFTAFSVFTLSAQSKVGGVTVNSKLKVGAETLELRGSGIRKKAILNVYVAALYSQTSEASAKTILSGDESAAIKLTMVTSLINEDKMINATREGFEKSTNGNTKPVQKEIDQLFGYLKQGITKGDECIFYYNAKTQTTDLYINKKKKGAMKGKAFQKAFFGIYLSDNPVSTKLKSALLK